MLFIPGNSMEYKHNEFIVDLRIYNLSLNSSIGERILVEPYPYYIEFLITEPEIGDDGIKELTIWRQMWFYKSYSEALTEFEEISGFN